MLKLGLILCKQNELMRSITLLLCVLIFLVSYSPVLAQEISPATKKSVVQNYKANLSEYLTFGTDCSLKPRGDANCDGKINQFDLSIWEIEFNAPSSPRRSDFNNDGVVNLLDFGIWRNTFYNGAKQSGRKDPLNYAEKLAQRFSAFLVSFVPRLASAQESPPNTQPLDGSKAFLSGSGNGVIVNSDTIGSQQVNFDSAGTPLSSQIYGAKGQLLAGISFLESGTTAISTAQDGVLIKTNRTAEGAVIEFYNNPDGSLIATKSWPSQLDYDSSQPPTSVTLPGKNPNTFLTLNIQPNGLGILQEINGQGDVLVQSQILANGFFASSDLKTKSFIQSNPTLGFVNLLIPNKIGGNTSYIFFKNVLTTITVTDSQNNFWQALQNPDGSWNLLGIVNGLEVKKTVNDPIIELKSGTFSPDQLLHTWNYYNDNIPNQNNVVDYSSTFNSNSRILTNQVKRANQVYAINQVPPPDNVLGIMNAGGVIKEASAQQPTTPWKNDKEANEAFGDPPASDSRLTTDSGYKATTSTGGTYGSGSSAVAAVKADFYSPGSTAPTSSVEFVGTPEAFKNAGITVGGNEGAGIGVSPQAMSNLTSAAKDPNSGISVHAPRADPLSEQPGSTPTTSLPANLPASGAAAAPPPAAPAAPPVPPPPPAPAAPPTAPPPPPPPAAPAAAPANTGLPAGWSSNVGPSGSIGGVSFTQTYTEKEGVGSITANFTNGSTQTSFTSGDRAGQVDFSFSKSDPNSALAGTTVQIGTNGSVVGFTTAGGTSYTIEGTGLFSGGTPISRNQPGGEGALNTANSVIGNNNEANDRQQNSVEGQCFLAGTLISTPNGLKAIESLKPGMKVYSYNEKTGQKETSDFKELDINFVDEYLIINGKIQASVYHPFYIVIASPIRQLADGEAISNNLGLPRRYAPRNDVSLTIRADELKIGDILPTEEGKYIPVSSIEKIKAPKTTVYNLMNVSPNNNFFAEGILVHNYDWSPPDFDADPSQTGASPDDPGTSYQDAFDEQGNPTHPDTARGGDGTQQPSFSSSGNFSEGSFGGGSVGGGDFGSGIGKGSGSGDSDGDQQQSGNQETQQENTQPDTGQEDSNTDSGNDDNGGDSGGSVSIDATI